MRNTTTEELLAELELLPYSARRRRLVAIGRAGENDAALAGLIAELGESPQAYHRLLALHTVCGSGDGARVVAALADGSRTVRQAAAGLVAFFCDDAQAAAALEQIVNRGLLRRTIQALSLRRRTAPVDAFLAARLAKAPEPHLIDLLPWGSAALVELFARRLEDDGADLAWHHLSRRHPAFVVAFLREKVAGDDVDWRWSARVEGCIATLALHVPDEALALLRRFLSRGAQPKHGHSVAAGAGAPVSARGARPAARARQGLGHAEPLRAGLLSQGEPRLGAERLAWLVQHTPASFGDGRRGVDAFLRLGEVDRRAVLDAFLEHGRGSWGAFLFRYLSREGDEGERRAAAFERWSRAARDKKRADPARAARPPAARPARARGAPPPRGRSGA